MGSQPLPTLSSDEVDSSDAPRQRSGTWGAKTERQIKLDKESKQKSKEKAKQDAKAEKQKKKDKQANKSGSASRSNSLERKKTVDDTQSPKKGGVLDAFRNRSSSDASKKKASAFMASMKSAMLVTIIF